MRNEVNLALILISIIVLFIFCNVPRIFLNFYDLMDMDDLIEYAAVYHCTSIHISQWLKVNYGQGFYQICMIHELKFSSDTMFSNSNGKKSTFFGNGFLKWPGCPKKH
jgi:hypothetical protein